MTLSIGSGTFRNQPQIQFASKQKQSAFRRMALSGLGLAAMSTAMLGCAPNVSQQPLTQQTETAEVSAKEYFKAPPKNVRYHLGIHRSNEARTSVSYILYDQESKEFKLAVLDGLGRMTQQSIPEGLYIQGVKVMQGEQKLLLPNGHTLTGEEGKEYDENGTLIIPVSELDSEEAGYNPYK